MIMLYGKFRGLLQFIDSKRPSIRGERKKLRLTEADVRSFELGRLSNDAFVVANPLDKLGREGDHSIGNGAHSEVFSHMHRDKTTAEITPSVKKFQLNRFSVLKSGQINEKTREFVVSTALRPSR